MLLKRCRDRCPDSTRSVVYLFNIFSIVGLQKPSSSGYLVAFYMHSLLVHFVCAIIAPLVVNLNIYLGYERMSLGEILNCFQGSINVWGLPFKIITIAVYFRRFDQCDVILKRLDRYCKRPEELCRLCDISVMGNRIMIVLGVMYFSYGLVTYSLSIFIVGQPPYLMYNPFMDWRRTRWEFTLHAIYEFFVMIYVLFYELCVDADAVIYLYIIQKHVQILVERVTKLGEDPDKTADQHYRELVECINCHCDIVELYDTIMPLFSVSMFIQFLCSTLALSICLINILLVSANSTRFGSYVYFIAIAAQIGLPCYVGTSLSSDVSLLPTAIFHCNWMDQDKRYRKMLIFFIQRTQQQFKLMALNIFAIDVNTFVNLAKFSFSLYTLLKEKNFGE